MTPALEPDHDGWPGLEIIARGANRMCGRDPARPGACLKFELPADQRTRVGLRQRLRRWLGRRFAALGDNRTELRAWLGLRERLGARLDGRIAASHGIVATAWGPALHCDCVCLADGTPAPSLYRLLFEEPRYPAQSLCAAVDAFEAWLLAHDVPLFDLNAGNLVVVPDGDQSPDGPLRLVCVDAKSVVADKEIVPLSRWSRRLRRRKIARRAQRLRQRILNALSGPPSLR